MSVQLVYETHSTTVDNERGIATGWAPGELSATGRRNAEALGRRRRTTTDLVISSDLARAVQTVEIAFVGTDVPVRVDVRLREVDYGELTGVAVAEIERQRPAHVDDPWPGGQSYRQVVAGVDALLDELVAEHDGARVLLVGHAATRSALDHLLSGLPLETAVAATFRWQEGWTWTLTAESGVRRS
jgi:broad specificity phosphatase PhoE